MIPIVEALRQGAPPEPPPSTPRTDEADEARAALERVLRCARCRVPITTSRARIKVQGKHRWTFVNPAGEIYAIACFSQVQRLSLGDAVSRDWSWFPPWAWSIAFCARCGLHVGWRYTRPDHPTFWGLIEDRLVEDAGPGPEGPA